MYTKRWCCSGELVLGLYARTTADLSWPSRSTELFDIIVDFPASTPALEDIKVRTESTTPLSVITLILLPLQTCLSKTDLRVHLVNSLRSLMDRRLLHPGADTKDIITQYIATIKCLRILDPAGVLLSRVADPIRRYLRFVLVLLPFHRLI